MEDYAYPKDLIHSFYLKDGIEGAGYATNRILFWIVSALNILLLIAAAAIFLKGDPFFPFTLLVMNLVLFVSISPSPHTPIKKVSFIGGKIKVDYWVPRSAAYDIAKVARFKEIDAKVLGKRTSEIAAREGLFCFKIYYPFSGRGPTILLPITLFYPAQHREQVIGLLARKGAPEKDLEEMVG